MSFSKAINDISLLLTQGGSPAAHSQDIAARLIAAVEDYYNFRESQRGNSEITDSSANSSAFRRAFSPPESNPGGIAGADGQGAYAWAVGKDGEDGVGQDGLNGADGFNGFNGGGFGGGGTTIDIRGVPCEALKAKLKDCGIKTGEDGKDAVAKCKTGKFAGLEICSILEQQATELGKQRRKLTELEDKIKEIEKQLKDAVECPP